ncbi:MAG: hypothetical protein HC889_20485 [Synechococcaceae cyanobacterium SM1_2_3]|nr:hypothetical protein [Synechococcaceae cyanobacterium SM1_2_3]
MPRVSIELKTRQDSPEIALGVMIAYLETDPSGTLASEVNTVITKISRTYYIGQRPQAAELSVQTSFTQFDALRL